MIAIALPTIHHYTPSYTRLLSVDMPFADPHRGAPYGEKNDPISAFVTFATVAGAELTLGAVLGGLMIAGGVMSGLGALTGNQTLSKIGGVLSLVGGIGTAFVDPLTMGFANPFTGNNFANSMMGQAASKIKNSFSFGDQLVSTEGVVANTGQEMIGDAIAPALGSIDAEKAGGANFILNDVNSNVTASAVDRVATSVSGGNKGGGLLSGIMGNKDLLNGASGMADAYMTGKDNEANRDFQQPLRDAQIGSANANASATNANTQLTQDRYNNMQAQPSVNIGVNPNVNLFNNAPTQEKKYAVVANGEVKYLNQAEYDALRQQQSGGGLLQQQGAA